MKLRILLAALALTALAPQSGVGATLVLLPCNNLSGQEEAPREVVTMLAAAMEKRGWTVVRGEEIESMLEAERVRYLDSLDSSVREQLLEQFHADAILFSTVYTYSGGRNPVVALSGRLVAAAGQVLWNNLIGVSADDVQGAFQFGRVNSVEALASRAEADLLRNFPEVGKFARAPGSRAKPWGEPNPATYASHSLAPGKARICILPLESFAESRAASAVAGEILALRLAQRFDVVEAGDVRRALVNAKIRALRGLDPEWLRLLGKRLGTSLFLTGTEYRYKEVLPGSGLDSPELDIQLTLTDVEAGRVIWTSAAARKGTDYARLLQFGTISNVAALADQVFAEMLRTEEQAAQRIGGKR